MEGVEGLTSTVVIVASTGSIGLTSSSPPYDENEFDPIVNTDEEVLESEIQALLTYEDHDQDHDQEHKPSSQWKEQKGGFRASMFIFVS